MKDKKINIVTDKQLTLKETFENIDRVLDKFDQLDEEEGGESKK